VIAIFLEKFLKNEVPTIHGDGSQERDYIHVDDVASANVAALEHQLQGTFHVCRNGAASVNDVVAALRKALGREYAVHNGPAKAGDPAKTRGSHALFTSFTGWNPTVDLDEGIFQTTAWFTGRQ
jgi:UDP-glucose 4-epimerase